MLIRLIAIIILALPTIAVAQEGDFSKRLDLAEKMLEIRPAQKQVERAVDAYIKNYMVTASDKDKELFRIAMVKAMNPKALEKVAIDAYAETFTLAELEAMVEYFSKPEAQSASDKQSQLNAKIAPEISSMMDRALMRLRSDSQ